MAATSVPMLLLTLACAIAGEGVAVVHDAADLVRATKDVTVDLIELSSNTPYLITERLQLNRPVMLLGQSPSVVIDGLLLQGTMVTTEAHNVQFANITFRHGTASSIGEETVWPRSSNARALTLCLKLQ